MHAPFQEANIPEAVILTIGGMALPDRRHCAFSCQPGQSPYYENGLYGLLLIVFALQIITLGKTPFGDLRRSKLLLASRDRAACVAAWPPVSFPSPIRFPACCSSCVSAREAFAAFADVFGFRQAAGPGFNTGESLPPPGLWMLSGSGGLAVLVAALIWKQQLYALPSRRPCCFCSARPPFPLRTRFKNLSGLSGSENNLKAKSSFPPSRIFLC